MRVPKPKKKTPRHRLVRTSVLKRIPLKHKAEKPKRFAKQRDPEYVAWIRSLPCIFRGRFGHQCEGPVEAAHYKSRGAGGADYANLYPACRKLHRMQHDIGMVSFCERWYSQGEGNALERAVTGTYPSQYEAQKRLGWEAE